jgi:hypothetical protein
MKISDILQFCTRFLLQSTVTCMRVSGFDDGLRDEWMKSEFKCIRYFHYDVIIIFIFSFSAQMFNKFTSLSLVFIHILHHIANNLFTHFISWMSSLLLYLSTISCSFLFTSLFSLRFHTLYTLTFILVHVLRRCREGCWATLISFKCFFVIIRFTLMPTLNAILIKIYDSLFLFHSRHKGT